MNGLRAALKKGFCDFVRQYQPDVLCLQETKTPRGEVSIEIDGYHRYWNHAEKSGYSGTAILSKSPAKHVTSGMGITKHDSEGRILTADFEDFFLVNVYVPNSKRLLERLPYRTQEWDSDFLKYLKRLEKKKPVIFCGDFNVAHKEIDLSNPNGNLRTHGFTAEERAGFNNIVESGFIDTFREFHKEGGHYSWWSPFHNCRSRNIGWRIDYVCISPSLRPRLRNAFILPDVHGSDHCPVGIDLA